MLTDTQKEIKRYGVRPSISNPSFLTRFRDVMIWTGSDVTRITVDMCDDTYIDIGEDFTSQLHEEFGGNMLYWSALAYPRGEEIIRKFMSLAPIEVALDLGTAKGATAALMTQYARRVYTLDRREVLVASIMWDRYGLGDIITFKMVPTNEQKIAFIKTIRFDFAFIDDQHDYEGAEMGFEATKKCGRVLFHDYTDEWPGVKAFVDTLPKNEVTIDDRFAYWEKPQEDTLS